MKSTYKFLLAAFAATVALASCTKDVATDRQDTDPQGGLRKIAVSFGTPTKTSLGDDGITPKFEGGEEILVADESGKTKSAIVKVGESEAYFETSLKGDLTAVYPATAALVNSDGTLNSSEFRIQENQTGLFKDANIASGQSVGDKIEFKGRTAVLKFYVGPEIGVTKLHINAVDTSTASSSWRLTESGNDIEVELNEFKKETGGKGRVCYVAVPKIPSTVKMTVDSYTTTQTSAPETPVTRVYRNFALDENQMVNVFIPYFINFETINQKWAYCNVGAFLPEESGYYFFWGDCTGCYYGANCWFFAEGRSEWEFTDEKYKRTNGYTLSGNIPLTEVCDAARYAWGEGWRMPTKEEASTLAKSMKSENGMKIRWGSENNDGLYIIDRTGSTLVFPACGYGAGSTLEGSTVGNPTGYYWTSTFISENSASSFTFSKSSASQTDFDKIITLISAERFKGLLIRPVYDSPNDPVIPPVGPDEPGDDDPDEGMTFNELIEHGENI